MKRRLIFASFCTLIIAFVGCKEKKDVFPPLDGDFVKNSEGRGTAQVWGINFDVADPEGVSAGSHVEGTFSSDFERTDAWNEITLGDDVKIRLEKVPGNTIIFKLNGKRFGFIKVGDIVVIDKKRNVTINGTIRQPEGPSP